MIESQVAKRAAEADTQSSSKLSQAAISTVHMTKQKSNHHNLQKRLMLEWLLL
jgi:hypothetical protein